MKHGFGAVALEFDDYSNATRTQAFEYAMRDKGLLAGYWHTDSWSLPYSSPSSDFIIAEIEDHRDYDGVIFSIPHLEPDTPRAVITTFWGLNVYRPDGSIDTAATRERCKPLLDAGFSCQTELYLSQSPNHTAEGLEFHARTHCGFTQVAPVFGLYGGKTLADYAQWTDIPGWGIYLAEYL